MAYEYLEINGVKVPLPLSAFPVGSIYMSVNDVNPASFLGGSWEQIKDRFLLSAGDTYPAGATGGSDKIYITSTNQLPLSAVTLAQNKTGAATDVGSAEWKNRTVAKDEYVATTKTVAEGLDGQGHGQPINYMPPYLAVFVWKRIA